MPAEIQVNVNLNETQAKSSIASIEQSYQHLKKELEKPVKVKVDETPFQKQTAAMEKATKAAEKLAQAHDKMGQSLGKIDASQATSLRTVTGLIRQQDGLSNSTVRATGIIRNSAGAFQTYAVSTKNAGNTMQNFRVSVNTATGEVQMLDKGIKSASVSFKGFGTQAMSFMKQIVGFYGVAQTLRKAFTEMKAMNDELVTYRKVTGASAADMQKMQSAAYAAAKNYGQSPSDFLASAATMARAGYKENSAAMAELATKTQLVGDMTADQASKFLIAVDAAYKYQGNIKQLSSVLDSANEIDNKYATTIEKISEGMTLVASVAATAEVPIEQLMAALGTMTAVTQREGSEAARGLRYILLHAMGDTTTEIEDGVTATEEGIQTLNEAVMQYGDEAQKAALKAGKMINPMEKIVALQKAWKEGTLSKESLYDIGLKVAGQRQYNMFMALIQNPDMYNSMMNDIANSAGSADKEWQAMMDSWSKKLEKLKATFTELVNNTISTDFIKSLIDAGTGALEFAGNLENLSGMALGAYASIKSLSAGLGNLAKGKYFGGFNAAGLGIGLAITAISSLKALGEKQFSDAVSSAQKAAQETQKSVDNIKNITQLVSRYNELVSDGIDSSELEEVKSLQSKIKDLVGETAQNYDLVNGSISENIKLLKNATLEYLRGQQAIAGVKVSEAGVGVNGAATNWLDSVTGAGLRFRVKLNTSNDKEKELAEYIEKNFQKQFLIDRQSKIDSKTRKKYELRDYRFQNLSSSNIDEFVENYLKVKELQKYMSNLYTTNELANNDFYKDIVSGLDKVSGAIEAYITAMENKRAIDAAVVLNEENLMDQTFASEDAVKSWVSALSESKGYDSEFTKALEDMALAMVNIKKVAEDGSKGMTTAADGAITLASAIDAATNAKKKFDDAMKTSKADAFNDYVKAFKTLQKEMKAGRVNSTAFYAAAEMLLGEEKYAATGGTSKGVRAALNKRTKGDSGSALQAWNILSGTYKNKKTGEAIEGYGFVELLKRTKGWGEKKITDKNGNIVIPSLSPEQIGKIANAWHIDSSFLMAAWNAFDQHDKKGERQADDLMAKKSEEAADAAEGAGDAEKTLADATATTATTMETAATAADKLASSCNNAADAVGKLPGDSVEGVAKNGNDTAPSDDSIQSDFMGGADDLIEKQGALIDTTKTLTKEYDGVIDGYNETIGEYDKLIQQAQAMSKKAAESLEEVNAFLQDSKTEETKKKADETQKIIDGMLSDPAFAAKVQAAMDAKASSEEPEKDISFAPEEQLGRYGKGNIDLFNRQPYINDDGTVSTVDSFSANIDGQEVLLPTIINGRRVTEEEAIKYYMKTGEHLGKFKTPEEADAYAQLLHEQQEYLYGNEAVVGEAAAKKAGEAAGKAFAEAESEAAEDEADISFADYYPELASGYAQAGEEAGQQFGEEYWKAMLQTADRYGQGEDIPDTLREQLEKDLTENGGDLWAVIEKYKKALSAAKGEAEDLNEELGGTEEKEVDVEVKDDEAKTKVSDITKDVHKKVFIDIINRSTPNGGGGGGGNMMATYASGTRSHAGGLALVNDGSGPELIVQNGQAFIAGGGRPTVVSLQKGAKVFTAGETRSIIGGSIPAYASGTVTEYKMSDIELEKTKTKNKKKKTTSSKKKTSKDKTDDKAFTNLASVVDYIIGRIGTALDEQLDVIDSQIDALKEARDVAEEQNKLEELQKNVTDALNERTVRYLGEDGKWHWMADQKNVQQAQKALKEYEDDLAFNAQVKALEDQKKALQKEYDQITKMWGEIKDGVNTPTTSLSQAISAVLKGGTAQQKTGAKAVQSSLIGEMTGSAYKKNYKEALSSISKASKGSPIMPNSGNPSLASLIAMSGLGSAGSSVTQALKTATSTSKSMTGSGNTLVGGNQTNINYFIDGIKLGQDMQNQPLSTIMRNLGVYTNTGVS